MFKYNPRRLIAYTALIIGLLSLASFIPALRQPVFTLVKFPLTVIAFLRHEIGGMVFYHRNMAGYERAHLKIDFLNRQLTAQKELELENRRLKALLDLASQRPYKVIAARVIGREPSNWSSTLIVDKGSSSGLRKGLVCISFLGLVGRVVEVTPTAAKVLLINDPNISVSALIQRSRQEGLVCGSLGGSLVMKYLLKESDVQVGDTVVTSGLTPAYPKGLLIGTVIALQEEFSSLSRYAVIRPAVALSDLEEILVIMP